MPATQLPLGFSNAAKWLSRETEAQKRNFRWSAVLGNQIAFDELGSVWDECKYPNWDGAEAKPIARETLHNAYVLIESLPLGCPTPTIGAEPDGEVTLEWHRAQRYTLSVSVTQDGNLHFAALLGPNRSYGTVVFFGSDVPQEILELIDRVCGA